MSPPLSQPTAAAVLVAAGLSTRMGATERRKPFLELSGLPLIEHVARAFDAAATVREIVIVLRPDDVDTVERWCAERAAFAKVRAVVEGGQSRAESVRRGVFWCSFDVDVVCVHDAARPLVLPAQIDRVVRRAAEEEAALLAVPVRDTLKRSVDGRFEKETVDRSGLWAAQTPQAFRARGLRKALARAQADGFAPTDDAALWERYAGPVALVEGDTANLKVTAPEDLAVAEALCAARAGRVRP